jgi:aminopeptidase N
LQDSHTTYLTLVVGEFTAHTDMVEGLPVQWYVSPGCQADGQRAFGDTPEMLRFFTARIGVPYPWSKYAQIAVADFVFGGMENTSATTQTDLTLHDERAHLDFSSNGLVAHELALQWFGNLLTCKHWSHAWLNEGFATYFDALFHSTLGQDEFRYLMNENARAYFQEDAEHYRRPLVTNVYKEPIDLFDRHLYEKGALVLHMLRYLLGEELFWRSITQYVSVNQHQVVETVDLERAIDMATGRNVQAFFTQWVYQSGYPEYQVVAWDEPAHMATVTVRRNNTGTEHSADAAVDMPVSLPWCYPTPRSDVAAHRGAPRLPSSCPARPQWLSSLAIGSETPAQTAQRHAHGPTSTTPTHRAASIPGPRRWPAWV